MELSDLMRHLTHTLERLQIPYTIVGSMATSVHGEPRLTHDIDVVVDLQARHVDEFCAAFPDPDYYLPREVVADSVRRRFQFNILQPATGYQVDVLIPGVSEFDRLRFSRAVRIQIQPDFSSSFASPEDVIIKKLEYFREGGSDKHIRDILGVLKIQGDKIDRAYIETWVATFGLNEQWQLILERLAM